MFDSHQAEITVMQFTGHSLPVHQSMSVPWDFYHVPFFQPSPPTRFLLITAIGMCHFLLVHHFGMACLAGSIYNIMSYPLLFVKKEKKKYGEHLMDFTQEKGSTCLNAKFQKRKKTLDVKAQRLHSHE